MCCIAKCALGTVLRIILVIINVPIMFCGLILLAMGTVLANIGNIVSPEQVGAVAGTGSMFIVGAILTVIGISGFCGAFCNSKIPLLIYFVVQCVLFLLALSIDIVAPIVNDNVNKRWKQEVMYEYGQPDKTTVTDRWDVLMRGQQCCGVDSYLDWHVSYYYNNTAKNNSQIASVPESCCKKSPENIAVCLYEASFENRNATSFTYLNTKGCFELVTTIETIFISMSSTTLLFLVFNAIISCCLMKLNE